MIEIIVNGKKQNCEADQTIQGFLESLEIRRGSVVVEHNKKVISRDQYSEVNLKDGDLIEVMQFVGGGSA